MNFVSMPQLSKYLNPAEWKVSKGASKLKIKVLGAGRISMLQFCDRLTLFEDAIHQIAKLISDTVEVKFLTQADIESIVYFATHQYNL